MKKILSLVTIIAMLAVSMFALAGCGSKNENNGGNGDAKKANTAEISTEFFKGTLKMSVPKKDDGSPKYEFTKERPADLVKSASGTVYLETEKAVITVASKGFAYQTGKDYKAKYGDVKATFQGYLDFIFISS